MKIDHPLAQELVHLLSRMNDPLGLTKEDLDRITAVSTEMNRLNPKFQIIDFVQKDQ